MISKANLLILSFAFLALASSAQQLFIHGDHIDEGFLLGDKASVVVPETEDLGI